jgi:ABC-type proline/glycine betaine transport system ATPase subunit
MSQKLHVVIVHKPVKIDEAIKLGQQFAPDATGYYRETESSYRFRNIPKTKFVKDSFRTKVINPRVSLVYGKLKE